MKYLIRSFLLTLMLAVGFTLSMNAQTSKPQSQRKEAALNQYCPVAYAAMEKAVKGNAKHTSTYLGKKYYLLNADAKKMFDADPAKYLPKYDGYCATAVAMGQKMESDPELFSEYEGATYLFSSKDAKEAFDKDPEATIRMADKQFASLEKKKH